MFYFVPFVNTLYNAVVKTLVCTQAKLLFRCLFKSKILTNIIKIGNNFLNIVFLSHLSSTKQTLWVTVPVITKGFKV